jgi:hypothetical protein
LVASDWNATKRPVALTRGSRLVLLAATPLSLTLMHSVVLAASVRR